MFQITTRGKCCPSEGVSSPARCEFSESCRYPEQQSISQAVTQTNLLVELTVHAHGKPTTHL